MENWFSDGEISLPLFTENRFSDGEISLPLFMGWLSR